MTFEEVAGTRRCILGVFAHPDDEVSGTGGTMARYGEEGVEIHVVTATRGEQGALGTGGQVVARTPGFWEAGWTWSGFEDMPSVGPFRSRGPRARRRVP